MKIRYVNMLLLLINYSHPHAVFCQNRRLLAIIVAITP